MNRDGSVSVPECQCVLVALRACDRTRTATSTAAHTDSSRDTAIGPSLRFSIQWVSEAVIRRWNKVVRCDVAELFFRRGLRLMICPGDDGSYSFRSMRGRPGPALMVTQTFDRAVLHAPGWRLVNQVARSGRVVGMMHADAISVMELPLATTWRQPTR